MVLGQLDIHTQRKKLDSSSQPSRWMRACPRAARRLLGPGCEMTLEPAWLRAAGWVRSLPGETLRRRFSHPPAASVQEPLTWGLQFPLVLSGKLRCQDPSWPVSSSPGVKARSLWSKGTRLPLPCIPFPLIGSASSWEMEP